jgi:glycosyltransferase involved in cell wall biosynthesis
MSFYFLRRPLYYIFEHLFLFLSSGIIIPSPYIYEITRKKIKRKYLYLIELTNEISFNQVTCIDKKQGNLLYVGSIEERKGLHYLLAALKMVPSEKYTLTIVGKIVDSKYKHKLDAVIQESSLNITFKGFVTDQELDDLYRSANVFVFPSLLEGYGIVLLEALSYGLPVIAFDNSAIPFTIKQNVNGILVKNKSIQAFAEALNRILSDDNLYIRLRAGALKSAQEARTFEQFTNDMRNFFLSLM